MKVIKVRNVHAALPEALRELWVNGVERPSRNGPVLVHPEPVTTVYRCPLERVLFWPERDANPFFHFFESLWMLAGRNDVEFLALFVPRMDLYSDNGRTFHGAYGQRWRSAFDVDQLSCIAASLKADPECRRQVLQIWDAKLDLATKTKDAPCNLTVHFQVNPVFPHQLDMSVFNRSNDIIWGCYGANAVHFSFLHEYVALGAGLEMGTYRQISDNWHAYVDVFDKLKSLKEEAKQPREGSYYEPLNPYHVSGVVHTPLFQDKHLWDQQVQRLLRVIQGETARVCPSSGMNEPFLGNVALPLARAHEHYRASSHRGEERYTGALGYIEECEALDWRVAAQEWIQRRFDKWKLKN